MFWWYQLNLLKCLLLFTHSRQGGDPDSVKAAWKGISSAFYENNASSYFTPFTVCGKIIDGYMLDLDVKGPSHSREISKLCALLSAQRGFFFS